MPSRSAAVLNQRLDEVRCLVTIALSRRTRGAKNIATEEPALMRGSLVLLCSHIEGYFEDLVEEIVLSIDSAATISSELPNALRMQQVLGTRKTLEVDDLHRKWKFVQNCAADPLLNDNSLHTSGMLDTALHTSGFANPGTTEIKRIFRTVGISDVWTEFSSFEPRQAYKNEIDAIVSRRNLVAHGDMNATVTASDIRVYADNFAHTASIFSRVAESHVAAYVPGFSW